TTGVRHVDKDTVFRIGSGSKLWTVLLLLKEMGDRVFSHPVGAYVPELLEAAEKFRHNKTAANDQANLMRWDEVTVGELASHMAGVTRDYGFMDTAFEPELMQAAGFPKLRDQDVPPCGETKACNRKDFFEGLLKSHPVVPTGGTPVYSNAAFQILGYVVENATGRSYNDLVHTELVDRLGLNGSYSSPPDPKLGVIPGDVRSSMWGLDIADETPAGGLFSSTRDMANVGRAILNSTLLPREMTRRWLKPVSHTSSLNMAVGAPWEIASYEEDRVVDIYTKSGDVGSYSSMLVLSPDHDVGFVVLAAGDSAPQATRILTDLVNEALIPGLDQAAKKEAQRFTGDYTLEDGKSHMRVTTDDGPGLLVTKWISNSKDLFSTVIMPALGVKKPSLIEVRLYPTGLKSPRQISFRAIPRSRVETPGFGPFSNSCTSWLSMDAQRYGNVGMDDVVFEMNEKGEVVGISPRASRVTLRKE
ncbi:serine hydrolase domain-containing protein, partial [Aspergillus candidus]